ncbi:MAG: T9SS type A sorting domain-containing protein [candidate division KSB1 bacterium]|nr:T9SS type A sorting domain-containing protein [candidate division KSB1 bacterium]MDZ7301049.1 T9SS type A sorting domain-containing protein [candidate division KSB1 bacterium]MDZ7312126.1 T9SS type A sorting domain-containing protein [candidate division KSB1 bacterium]
MRRIGFGIVMALLLVGSSFAQGQVASVLGVNPVTFQVDMSIQKQLNKFSPTTQIVVIRGNFINEADPTLEDWKGNIFELSPSQGNPDVYTLVVNLPDNVVGTEFEFKYVIDEVTARGDKTTQGGNWESIDNRKFTLQAGGQVLDKVFFNNQSQVGVETFVTFKVKMNVMKEVGFFDPTAQTVHVRGSFNGWGDGSDLADPDGDLTYEGRFNVGSTSPIKYKFVVKKGTAVTWEDNIGDRVLNLVGTEMVLNPVEWTDGVQFRVNMSAPINTGLFNPATQFVSIAGGFNDWLGTALGISNGDSATARKYELKDPDGDKVYVANIEVGKATNKFKFTINNNSNGKIATWEGHADRSIDLKTATLAKPTNVELPWDGDPGVAVTGTVLFQVDISPLRDNGIFNEAEGDTLQVRGEFNGWSDADPATSIMRQSFLNPNIYDLPITLLKVPGSKLAYKFYIKFNFKRALWAGIANPNPDWGYEEPGSTGGGNRTFVFSGEPQQVLDPVPYKDIYDFIPAGVEVTYNFVADMRCYLRDPANLADKNTDTLRAHVQDIVWHIFNGTRQYQDANNLKGVTPFNFTDTDGDSVYTLALKTKGLNQNWVQYKLRWEGIEESAPGFEYGRRRVRYVRRDASGNFLPSYQMGVDYFSTTTDPLPIETPTSGVINDDAPCTITSVLERIGDKIPNTYSLGQNYPNPFNPTTTFEYSVPKSGHVSITLYNALGQKVADLVDEVQQAGTYKVTVDLGDLSRSSLATGVYIYKMKVGNFQTSRRMMFMK